MNLKLSENQVALLLKYAPDDRFEIAVDRATATVSMRWGDANPHTNRAAKFEQMEATDAYDIEQLGFEIVPDGTELAMAVVTPIPDGYTDDGPFDLREITSEYVFDIREETVKEANALREKTGLRPRLFVAAMVSMNDDVEPETETFRDVARYMGFSPTGLKRTIKQARKEIREARAIVGMTTGEATVSNL